MANLRALLDDYPDYATEPTALKQINQSINDLNYKLWKLIEKKKDEATKERDDKTKSRILYVFYNG